ncbi:hypothetical protein GALMADRAFT_235050 [Galerina marginata CBS 339.88]|uniref:EKC/KEOPS complex subunit GON7 n=1 Tax=Galerina marginata (strain CBS 339.88) TaxID=685588 RepID=A0A067TU84_GALM3|nr:hypothetical protein GALMADRAFT_235050 [Galerina marginata CBS 339.88]
MAPATIKIVYDLKPPIGIDAGDKPTAKKHVFEVTPDGQSTKEFYTALRSALEAARNEVGDELTAWRDIVGKAELSKEPKKKKADEEEDEDVDEEMEEEEQI